MAGMTELAFARQFLTALDSRAIKLPSDHVADPKQYPAQGAYTLPRLSNQPLKRKREPSSAAPGAEKAGPTVTVSLKNTKSPTASYTLDATPLSISVFDLKSTYAARSGAPVDKIKLLYNKKPTSDAKTVKDLLGDAAEQAKDVEFTVMVMGGIPAGASPGIQPVDEVVNQAAVPPVVAQGTSGREVLGEDGFWTDLEGFLMQRIRDEAEAARLTKLFRSTWQKGAV